jgi:hypothetical protein
MRVKVAMPTEDSKRLREKIVEGAEKIEDDEIGQEEWTVVRLSNSSAMPFLIHIIGHVDRSGAVPSYQRDTAEGMQRTRTDRDDVLCCNGRFLECGFVSLYAIQIATNVKLHRGSSLEQIMQAFPLLQIQVIQYQRSNFASPILFPRSPMPGCDILLLYVMVMR